MSVTIFHNPACGTSRNVLRILTAAGYAPEVVDYLKGGWTLPQLIALFSAAGITPKQALREATPPAKALGLLEDGVSDAAILAAMVAHPVLVNRPIVVTPKGTKLCRPSELVLDLLETWPPGPFLKEDGGVILDENGQRVV